MIDSMLQKISLPIESNLEEFDNEFNNSLKSDVRIINTIVKYIVRKKERDLGKGFVFFQLKFVETSIRIRIL